MCRTSIRCLITTCCAASLHAAGAEPRPRRMRPDRLVVRKRANYIRSTLFPADRLRPAYCVRLRPACGCAPAQPACQTCVPATSYRIAYQPVATVTYMPVTGVNPCSGCPVTTYQPATAWTYRASLVPYQVGYAPVAASPCSTCGGCAPCSGYSTSYGGCSSCGCASYGGCSSCYGGCSSCGAGSAYGGCSTCGGCTSGSGCSSCGDGGGCGLSSGCSSCGSGQPSLPGPSDMSQPPLNPAPTTLPAAPATIGPPTAPPVMPAAPGETPHTYVPGANGAPVAPGALGAPTGIPSHSGASYAVPPTTETNRAEPPRIDNVPSLPKPPEAGPAPAFQGENHNLTTARPVQQATYFQLLPSPPSVVPARLISAPVKAAPPIVDSGWLPADR